MNKITSSYLIRSLWTLSVLGFALVFLIIYISINNKLNEVRIALNDIGGKQYYVEIFLKLSLSPSRQKIDSFCTKGEENSIERDYPIEGEGGITAVIVDRGNPPIFDRV